MKFFVFWLINIAESDWSKKKGKKPPKNPSPNQISKPQSPKKKTTKQTTKQTTTPWNKQQKQTNKISCYLSGWLFQIAIAVCPTLYGHVKDKAHNWKGEMGEICIGKLDLCDCKNIIVIVVIISVRMLVKHWIVYSQMKSMQRSVVNKQIYWDI